MNRNLQSESFTSSGVRGKAHAKHGKQVAEVCNVIFKNSSTISTVNINYLRSTLKNLRPKYFRFIKKIVNDINIIRGFN